MFVASALGMAGEAHWRYTSRGYPAQMQAQVAPAWRRCLVRSVAACYVACALAAALGALHWTDMAQAAALAVCVGADVGTQVCGCACVYI